MILSFDPVAVEDELMERGLSYEALPILCELLFESMDNSYAAMQTMRYFIHIDGKNMTSHGNEKALRLTREIIAKDNPPLSAFCYLVLKGNGNDIAALEKAEVWNYNKTDFIPNKAKETIEVLKARVNGTNIMGSYVGREDPYIDFIPSVANTGPQAKYVYDILKTALEKAGGDKSKIPSELLTMTISFDRDDNPVSSVDLVKYGLTMPVVTPKPVPRSSVNIHPNEAVVKPSANTIQEDISLPGQPQTPPKNKNPLLLGILALLAVIGGMGVWYFRKK